MSKGYLCIVLHAHLPFVRHPEHEEFLEEDWFYEAVIETYIPLITVFEGLVRDKVDFRLTMSLSPTLCAMMQDPLLQKRCLSHIERLIELAGKEKQRTRQEPEFHALACMYHDRFTRAREVFLDHYGMDLTRAFRAMQERGCIEIITCAATHGFLPLLRIHPEAVRAQVLVGVQAYEKVFGVKPKGIWLPECGYYPGLDEILAEARLRYFFVDSDGLMLGSATPKYGVYAPVCCPSGVAAFGRDGESSNQVWSSKAGYPGDPDYREFYRDIGYDLDFDYVKPYILPDGTRINTGIKYYRITGETGEKQPYVRERALKKTEDHAGNFMFNRERQIEWHAARMDRKPVVVAPYDAELLGHWWFEGPEWLDFLFRKSAREQKVFEFITPSEYLREYPRHQLSTPCESSWGVKGHNEMWLCGKNDWIYRHLHAAADRMIRLATENRRLRISNCGFRIFKEGSIKSPNQSSIRNPQSAMPLKRRALNQAARELLLAQASDWAFIMRTGTMVEYAERRMKGHLLAFTNLYNQIEAGAINEPYLESLESQHNIFPEISHRVFATPRPNSLERGTRGDETDRGKRRRHVQ